MVTVAKLYGSRPGSTSGPPLSATQWVRLSEMVTLWGLARYSAKFQSQSHVWRDVLFRVSKSYILFWESKSLCTTLLMGGGMVSFSQAASYPRTCFQFDGFKQIQIQEAQQV